MILINLLKKIDHRLLVKAQKKLIYLADNLLIYLIVRAGFKRYPSSIPGYYNVVTKKYFYKIVLKNFSFFIKEKEHIDFIREQYPEISKIIFHYEYLWLFRNKVLLIKTKKLGSFSEHSEKIKVAEAILRIFRVYGHIDKCKISELTNVSDGLNIIKFLLGDDFYKRLLLLLEMYSEKNTFSIGPCHGDFHYNNIMSFRNKSYIIDLDCFRASSLQELDAIYFINQNIADCEHTSWYKALINLICNKPIYVEYYAFLEEFMIINKLNSYCIIYFLDRLGQDFRYQGQDFKYVLDSENLLKSEIVHTIKFLINSF